MLRIDVFRSFCQVVSELHSIRWAKLQWVQCRAISFPTPRTEAPRSQLETGCGRGPDAVSISLCVKESAVSIAVAPKLAVHPKEIPFAKAGLLSIFGHLRREVVALERHLAVPVGIVVHSASGLTNQVSRAHHRGRGGQRPTGEFIGPCRYTGDGLDEGLDIGLVAFSIIDPESNPAVKYHAIDTSLRFVTTCAETPCRALALAAEP